MNCPKCTTEMKALEILYDKGFWCPSCFKCIRLTNNGKPLGVLST